jgi:hypothetical protein
MSDSENRLITYIERFGAGSIAISLIIHVIILGSATVFVVNSGIRSAEPMFLGGG